MTHVHGGNMMLRGYKHKKYNEITKKFESEELPETMISKKEEPIEYDEEPIKISHYKTYSVTAKKLNVREGPSKKDNKVGILSRFDRIKVVELIGDWGKVYIKDQKGYVLMGHLALL